MADKNPVFVGVELMHTAGRLRRAYVYAGLDDKQELLAIGHGDQNELLAYLGGQQRAYVAINAPRKPNTGVVNTKSVYQSELPLEQFHHSIDARLCEHQLHQLGCKIDYTPSKVKSCPRWMQRGFDLYRRLANFGYAPFPNPDGPRHSLETRSEAIFWRLLGGKSALPPSLEGRLQRQLILYDRNLPVPDAMDFFLEITRHRLIQGELPDEKIHTCEELNALAAAHIAWQAAHDTEQIELLGDPDEGEIALPTVDCSLL